MIKQLSVVCILLIGFNLSGCGVSFSKRHFKDDLIKLNSKNYERLNGAYSSNPQADYNPKAKYFLTDSVLKKINTYNLFTNKPLVFSKLDSLELRNSTKKFALRFIDTEHIEISYLINDVVKSSEIIKGRIKKNGLFYLDNKYFKSNGIPYLWGGIDVKKRRIGLSESGNLIFNGAYCREGALLFLFAAGTSYNNAYEIEKIN